MKNFTYKAVIKYLLCSFFFVVANCITQDTPLSIAFLPAFMGNGFSPLATAILFCIVALLFFSLEQTAILLATALFLAIVFAIYKSKNKQVKGEFIFYLLIALTPYIFTRFFTQALQVKLIYSAIIYAFAIIFNIAVNVIFVGKFQKKCARHERVALYLFTVIFSLGLIALLGVEIYRLIAISLMLFLCKFFKGPKAFVPAFLLPVAIALYTNGISVLAIFQIYCATILLFIDYSPLLSALALTITQFTVFYFSGEIFAFKISDFLLTLTPTLIFLFTPAKIIEKLRDFLLKFEEPELTREVINIQRGILSLKLNELSALFYQMENALNCFDELLLTNESMSEKIAEECVNNVCTVCPFFADCKRKRHPNKDDLLKLISVGLSKGKISLIDLSRDFSSYCYSVNGMIYEINRLIFIYLEKTEENEQTLKFKRLISTQSNAVAQVLSQLGYEFSCQIEFNRKIEKAAINALYENGVTCKQIICVGDNLHLLFDDDKIVYSKIANILSVALNKPLALKDKRQLRGGTVAIFQNAPRYDACFGIAQRSKEGAVVCGDCHSLTKINEGCFLVSLCDGMGSGYKAYKNSQTAISLFECFYKSGLPRENSLTLANKILCACSEESFATLDLAIFNLFTANLDSVKIGASCGFLISEDCIKIIENDSLPLGILDEIQPNLTSLQLKSGDILVLLSDGVSDAFFSNTDTVDFLLTQSTRNPQTLANNLLEEALKKYEGVAKDDMTVICVKIYNP
ncbi:MAG: hypothetical protein E7339_00640 [Clostridiales bacterium]|nr:hypothetical protein [Clostridiales bacterium]